MAAAPAAGILALFELMLLSFVALLFFRWLVQSLVGWIPFVGNKAVAAADAVTTYVERKCEDWLFPQLHTLLVWLETLAVRVLHYPQAALDALVNVDAAFDHLVRTKIPALVHALTTQLRLDVAYLSRTVPGLVDDVAAFPGHLEKRLGEYGGALSRTLLKQFENGIDRLQRDVINPADHALGKAIDAVRGESIAGVKEAEGLAIGVGHDLRALARRLDIPLTLLETLVGAFGAVAVLEALQTLVTCRGKLTKMCTSDPAQWGRFIEGLALLAAWPGLVEITREAQGILREHRGAVHDLIVNGG